MFAAPERVVPTNEQGGVVHYRNSDGTLEAALDIPYGSTFARAGSSSAPVLCDNLPYRAAFDDPRHPHADEPLPVPVPDGWTDPAWAEGGRPSYAWEFVEVTDTAPVDNEAQLQDLLYKDHDVENWHRYLAATAPLAELMRRFDVNCLGPLWTGGTHLPDYQNTIEVSVLDPFFGVQLVIDQLRARIDLDPITVATNPTESTFGGLVVNMPTHLSIGSTPWKIYADEDVSVRDVRLLQTVSPRTLEFVVTFTPEGAAAPASTVRVPCIGTAGAVERAGGLIPARPASTPDFATEDPGLACVWLPTHKGTATIRAQILYDVTIHAAGRTAPQMPYLWVSEPLTMVVDELRIVNVVPD